MTQLNVSGKPVTVNVGEHTLLLRVVRERIGLTGTKFSYGIAQYNPGTLHLTARPRVPELPERVPVF